MLRVVIDTCVIVAAVKSRKGASFVIVELAGLSNQYFEIVLSTALISEYEDVIGRPEHRTSNWTDLDLYALIQSLLVPAHWAATNFSYRPSLKDPGDEFVLEAAINGQAEKLVTFNQKDFGPAKRFGIDVITPAKLLQILVEKGFIYGKE